MAVMPGAQFTNTAIGPLMSRYDIVCIHTIVGYAPAHAAHFSTTAAGHIFQSRDTKYKSAANLNGNHRIIAIENEDRGAAFGDWNVNDGHAVPAFTEGQIEAIARICAWAYQVHNIPLVLAPDSKPTSRGIAFHRQGCDGNFAGYAYGGRVAGGELWSNAFGKVCPGDRRINQLINRIIPRARQIAGLPSSNRPQITSMEDDTMYIRNQPTGQPERFALLSGPIFVGLTPGETLDAKRAISEGSPYQWVDVATWDELDRRSKALTNYNVTGLPVRVVNDELDVHVSNESVNVVDVTPAPPTV
jgi:hypothetical protein